MRVEHILVALDLEQTAASFHAYAIPSAPVREGDTLLLSDVPDLAFGARIVCERSATLRRAGLLRRALTRLGQLAALTDLYEVGFQPQESAP